MATERPWVLAETTWHAVRSTQFHVAILPWGATEAHNYHLPYATDNIESEFVAAESARIAWQAGAHTIALPAIPFGVNTGQLDIPLCINMNPSTQTAVLGDVIESVERAGIQKLVILNGHGGNDFRQIIRELQPSTSVFLCLVNWYSCVDPKPFFQDLGDHAGELETSVMQQIVPDLVRPLSQAGDGRARKFKIQALREGWAWAPRQWTKVTDDTGVGNPAAASPEKGAKFLAAVCERISNFLIDLANADTSAMYQE